MHILIITEAVYSLRRVVDYYSTSLVSQSKRKLSLHLSEPVFRDSLPKVDEPFATEYRPGRHAKPGPRDYFLSGVNKKGDTYLVNFSSESVTLPDGSSTLTDTPQTGILTLDDKNVVVRGDVKPGIRSKDIIRISSSGKASTIAKPSSEEIMLLGLEYDKMQLDTPLYNDPNSQERYVIDPTARNLHAIGEFTQRDPSVVASEMLNALATYWNRFKPNKSRR